MRTRGIVGVGVLIVLVISGYFLVHYVIQYPPTILIKMLTHMDPPPPLPAGDVAPLTVSDGFIATIFSREVPGARVLIRDPKGTLLVSLTRDGKVVALPDRDSDGKADQVIPVLENLRQPHGLAIHCPQSVGESASQDACVLYVAETGELKAYAYDADTYRASYTATIATFPSGDGHFTRTLMMHPDGKRLLVSIGSSCNVCHEEHPVRATIQAIDIATRQMSPFAIGLRNSVFMATDPVTGEVWATENGRDVIGDEIPPDEVNIITEGKNYGWPLCYGQKVHDTSFDSKLYDISPCDVTEAAHIDLQAHSAALGLAFIPEEGWPEVMRNDLLIAFHGSWNRSVPTGYKVVHVDLDQHSRGALGTPVDFVTGFLEDGADEEAAIGRPAGLLAEPGGVVYVSDDRAGAIYRVAYHGSE